MRPGFHPVLAGIDLADRLNPLGTGPSPMARSVMRDAMVVVGAAVGVAVLLLLLAVFFRKLRKRQPDRSVSQSKAASKSDLVKREEVEGSAGRRKSRYRRRRREHRSMNPTLSETGGLPPERPEER
jgi:hypothetical protein